VQNSLCWEHAGSSGSEVTCRSKTGITCRVGFSFAGRSETAFAGCSGLGLAGMKEFSITGNAGSASAQSMLISIAFTTFVTVDLSSSNVVDLPFYLAVDFVSPGVVDVV